jgi:NAD(P)-dependent dehydrogenase (short-subunit alcohol dehydrogenase family)
LITGAATGIGKACAGRLASSGWRVFGGARGVSQPDSRVEMIVMDVNDEASVQDALTLVLAKAGRLDAVINNAGFSMGGAVEDVTIEEAKAIFETNFFGVLPVCRAALPALRAHGGYVVNISSLVGVVGSRGGRTHTVTVTEDGFEHAGEKYPSLTNIAKKITGAHWSGPRFFGLPAAGAERPGKGQHDG